MAPFITIIGLGNTGTSLGLALRREPGSFEVVGHDRAQNAESEARRLGAVHRTEWNLHRAVEGASLVLLALPLPAIEETLPLIAEDLAPEALLLIVNPLMQPVVEGAARALPGHARTVAGHPIAGLQRYDAQPSAEQYAGTTFCLAATPQTDPAAMELASDFVERIGAKPHFVDPAEHDGIMALVELMPQVMGAALIGLSTRASGWREVRQLAGRRFAQSSETGQNAEQVVRALLANRENVLQRLAQYQAELGRWQGLLEAEPEEGQPHPLLAAVQEAIAERAAWEGQAAKGEWESAPTSAANEASGGLFRQLFLGNLGRRKPPAGGAPTT